MKNHVCHDVFEHTTLISTILHRFAANPGRAIAKMPWRVHGAPHLGSLLESEPRADLADRDRLNDQIEEARAQLDEARHEARRKRRARDGKPSDHYDGGAGVKQELYDWQEEFVAGALTLRKEGLPPGQP